MGVTATAAGSGDRGGPVMVALTLLYSLELLGIIWAATVVASLGQAHLGRGAGLLALSLLAAAALLGWHAVRLLSGRRRLGVTGLAVQSALLISAIALATQRPGAGVAGVAVSAGVLAGWGRLSTPSGSAEPLSASLEPPPQGAAAVGKPGFGGVPLALLTAALVLGALSVRGGIVVGLVVLAIIFVPIERAFGLRPRRILRAGWRTDVVHCLINGAALKVGMVVAVAVVGSVLRAFVPTPCRAAIAASPGWAQIVAALAIATVGGYAGHRAAHEIPLLWRFHRVHHSIRELDWLAANHLHPLDQIFIRSAAVLPLYALGFGRISLAPSSS